jgi:archaemetzincin
MPSYELLALLGGIVFAGLFAYQRLWTRIFRRRSRFEGLSHLRGRVLAAGAGAIQVEPDGPSASCLQTSGSAVEVRIDEAELITWPGPGAWRRARDLRAGDPVTVVGVEAPGQQSPVCAVRTGAQPRFEAIRVIRGDWPELPWFGLPVALGASLVGLFLSQLIREPVLVASVIPSPSASVRYAHDAPSVRAILDLTRRTEEVHDWATAGVGIDAPARVEPEASTTAEPGGELAPARAESLFDYLESRPRVATAERRYLYLQPIGELEGRQREVLAHTADFLARYTCLPVKVAAEIPLSKIAWHARRVHPGWGIPQLLSTWLVHGLLRSRRPDDAAAYLGLTGVDLWPGPGWHSVNGHASPVARVGVLSTYRNGGLAGAADFRLHLLRTLKVAAHETAHIFSIRHCPRRGCNMSNRNDRAEADRRVLALCPDCLAKLLAATGCDPIARFRSLIAYFERHRLAEEAALHQRSLGAVARAAE